VSVACQVSRPLSRLIRKVYEADPLECPKCKAPMCVIALIDDPGVVRRILEHLGHRITEFATPVASHGQDVERTFADKPTVKDEWLTKMKNVEALFLGE
jgi:hypothetical protein